MDLHCGVSHLLTVSIGRLDGNCAVSTKSAVKQLYDIGPSQRSDAPIHIHREYNVKRS